MNIHSLCPRYYLEEISVRLLPFNALRDDAIERQREHPRQVADAMRIEHLSLALNPRGTLYKGHSLIQITVEAGNDAAVLAYRRSIESEEWALYRVRRIFTGKGRADRAVEKLHVFEGPAEARMALNTTAARNGVAVEELRGTPYIWHERRSETDFRLGKSSSRSRRLLSKPKRDMDWIGSKGAGPHYSFPCFDPAKVKLS